jgi:hypothetical protein
VVSDFNVFVHGFLLLPDTVCSCPFPAIFRSFPAVSLHFPAGSVGVPVRLRYQEPAGKTRFRVRRFSRPEYCFRVPMFFRQVPAGICADPAGKTPERHRFLRVPAGNGCWNHCLGIIINF